MVCITDKLGDLNIPRPVTNVSLSENPGVFIPILKNILNVYEQFQVQDQENVAEQTEVTEEVEAEEAVIVKQANRAFLPRLFSLFPTPSLRHSLSCEKE